MEPTNNTDETNMRGVRITPPSPAVPDNFYDEVPDVVLEDKPTVQEPEPAPEPEPEAPATPEKENGPGAQERARTVVRFVKVAVKGTDKPTLVEKEVIAFFKVHSSWTALQLAHLLTLVAAIRESTLAAVMDEIANLHKFGVAIQEAKDEMGFDRKKEPEFLLGKLGGYHLQIPREHLRRIFEAELAPKSNRDKMFRGGQVDDDPAYGGKQSKLKATATIPWTPEELSPSGKGLTLAFHRREAQARQDRIDEIEKKNPKPKTKGVPLRVLRGWKTKAEQAEETAHKQAGITNPTPIPLPEAQAPGSYAGDEEEPAERIQLPPPDDYAPPPPWPKF